MQAGYDDLTNVEEVGSKIAESIVSYFANQRNIELVQKLKNKGIRFELNEQSDILVSEKLQGKSFVVSGVFNRYPREQIKKIIEENGGKNVSSISAKTDYFLPVITWTGEKEKSQ